MTTVMADIYAFSRRAHTLFADLALSTLRWPRGQHSFNILHFADTWGKYLWSWFWSILLLLVTHLHSLPFPPHSLILLITTQEPAALPPPWKCSLWICKPFRCLNLLWKWAGWLEKARRWERNWHSSLLPVDATLHRIWDSSNCEVQPISIACTKRLTRAVCPNDRGSKHLHFMREYMLLFCKNCIFQECAVWLMCGVQQEAQQTSSLPLWRQQMHVGEIWCTGWENPSLGMVMKEHRRGRRGRAVLHRNSLSRPSSPTSMKNKGPHRAVHKSGIPFIPGHFINSNSSFLMTLKQRHCLMHCAECWRFYVLSERV